MQSAKSREKLFQQLQTWDALIKAGKSSSVAPLLKKLKYKSIARDQLLECAQVARRVGKPELIVAWYAPIIGSEKILEEAPTPQENAIYAFALFRLGGFAAAEKILSEIDPDKDPQIRYYRACLHMNQWSYSKAIPDLKQYVRDPRVEPYAKLVGRLNLCASLVAEGWHKSATAEIARLMKILRQQQLSLLLGNLLEVQAQLDLQLDQPAAATEHLHEAAVLLKNMNTNTRIWVKKWTAINQIQQTPSDQAYEQLEQVKLEALRAADWESARDCDLQKALLAKDDQLLLKVYWGSLFPAYKQRILRLRQWTKPVLEDFIWRVGASSTPAIDLVQRAPSPVLRKLFFVLTRELYRPLRITEILERMYKDEHFDPHIKYTKLRQAVVRARLWLKAENFPLEIKSFKNSYKLNFIDDGALVLKNHFEAVSTPEIPQNLLNMSSFTTADWAKANKTSARSARREIAELVAAGKIQSFIRGPRTHYKIRS